MGDQNRQVKKDDAAKDDSHDDDADVADALRARAVVLNTDFFSTSTGRVVGVHVQLLQLQAIQRTE